MAFEIWCAGDSPTGLNFVAMEIRSTKAAAGSSVTIAAKAFVKTLFPLH